MPPYYPMYPTLMSALYQENTLQNIELVTWSELLVMYKTNKLSMSANSDTPVPYTTAIACRAMVLIRLLGLRLPTTVESRTVSIHQLYDTGGPQQ